MLIKLDPSLPESTNISLTAAFVVLKEVFGKYEQLATLKQAEEVSKGPVVMPIVAFAPRRVKLKNNGIKNTFCEARFAVYSKRPDETIPPKEEGEKPTIKTFECLRYIHGHRTGERETTLKSMPAPVRDAHFDEDGILTIGNLVDQLGGVPADKISFFYNPVTCEGVVTHCVAVVHEFGPTEDPQVVITSYLSINISK